MATEFRRERHSASRLLIHLVCVTKYRRPVLSVRGLKTIERSFETVAQKMNFEVLEFNGEADHVHALLEYPPKLSVSQLVNHLKGVSSRRYHSAGFRMPCEGHLWSPSYFVVSVGGAPLETLKAYIRQQKKPS